MTGHKRFSLARWAANAGLVAISLAMLGLLLEFVVFRLVLPAADYPRLDARGQVLRYEAGDTGTYRVQDEISARFAINANGWNSRHSAYETHGAAPRIAVIGDSYVAAFMVDVDLSLAERLEDLGDGTYEVFRFGIDGAPLSHYVWMLRHEVLPLHPDLVILNLVHNDIRESHAVPGGVYTRSFAHVRVDQGHVVDEQPPEPFNPPWYSFLRRSATWRYLGVRRQVRFQALRDLLLARNDPAPRVQANIDVAALGDQTEDDRAATSYLLRQAKELCQSHGAGLLVVMDGVRQLVYPSPDGPWDESTGALSLNAMVRDVAAELDISFLDLHPVFAAHYRAHGQRFEFEHDGHWNALGHQVAAVAIHQRLERDPELLPGSHP